MNDDRCRRLSCLRDELAGLEAQPWGNIQSWIAKATPIMRSDWPKHLDAFREVTAEPKWITPRVTLSELQRGVTPAPNASDVAKNKEKAETAKRSILGFLDGLQAISASDGLAASELNGELPQWVIDVLRQPESDRLEFKTRVPDQHDMAKQLSALANTEGGLLVLGVLEGGDVVGLQDAGRAETAIRLAAERVSPTITVTTECFSTDNGSIVIAKVAKGEQLPHTVSGQAYQRVGDRVVRLSEADRSPEFDVFLAHNAEDRLSVFAIAEALRSRGVRVWLDAEQISPGDQFQDAIQRALQHVSAVAVVIGAAGIGQWQAAEIRSAITLSVKHNVPVIPVLLPGVNELPRDIPFLAEFNWVRFVERVDEEASIERLFWGVTGRRPPSASRSVAATNEPVSPVARKPTSANPGVGIPGRSGKVLFGLHGIMTHAGWARTLYEVGADAAWQVRMDRWYFGYFWLLQFLSPWVRRAKVRWFCQAYKDEMENRKVLLREGELPSIVAHSFGTYILGNALLKYDWLRFNKVVLCGSILPQDFPWDKLIERGQVQAVRNEHGVRDIWTGLVRWFVAGTGPSGRRGFKCSHERFQQEQFDYTHSEYFNRGHIEAKWLPFLGRALQAIPQSEVAVSIPSATRPWGLYLLYAILLTVMIAVRVLQSGVGNDQGTSQGPTAESNLSAAFQQRLRKSLADLSSRHGNTIRISLFIGGPLIEDDVPYIELLSKTADEYGARLVALSSPRLKSETRSAWSSVGLRFDSMEGRKLLDSSEVDVVFFIGFANISGTVANPFTGSQQPLSAKAWLDLCVVWASQAGKDCYVFYGPDRWSPNDAAKKAASKYQRVIWKGDRTASDLGEFFAKVTGHPASGPIVPVQRKGSSVGNSNLP